MTFTNRLKKRIALRWLCSTMGCLLISFYSLAQYETLTEKVSINLKKTTALQVIRELDRQSNYSFSYTQTLLDKIIIETFSYDNILLGKALELLGGRAGLGFQVSGSVIAVKVATQEINPSQPPVRKNGKVTGYVRNADNEPMPGVSISVEGMDKGTSTTVSGDYVLALPPGRYTFIVSFIGYQTKRITDVDVKAEEVTGLSISLDKSDNKQLQAVVVTSGAKKESVRSLLMTQKNSAGMTNGISAEQIRVTPDNNTAQVLKRVSGITVQNDKFVTIRGVSDRYNNVLINGSSLPSTEPNRRNFSFDIIPSALVDNIIINKTATPDLPGEFTGGLVQVNSKDVPAENFLSLQVGTGFNTASAGKDFISLRRDKKAAFGIIDEERKWFGDGRVFDQQQYIKYLGAKDTANLRKVGGKIPNRWQPYKYEYTPQQNYQLAGGVNRRFQNNSSVGAVAALTYLNEQFYEEGEARNLNSYDMTTQRYRYNTTIGGLLNLAFKSKKHKIAWKNLYNKRYSDQYDDRYGYQQSSSDFENRTGDVILSNRLLQTRLEGEHSFFKQDIRLSWYGDYIDLVREQPDGRFLAATDADSGAHVYRYNFSDMSLFRGGLYASQLKEERNNAGANLSIPFTMGKSRQLFKAGYAYSKRRSDFDATGIRLTENNGYGNTMLGMPYYEIATVEAVKNGSLSYTPVYSRSETTGDRYTGTQLLHAAYSMLDLKITPALRLTGGARFEQNKITISTVFYNIIDGNSNFKDSVYLEKDWLPSVNLTYSLTEKFNIRAAWSKTLARPDFVERSPYMYYDFTEQLEVTGQTALESSRIRNYDLRFEYYPSGAEVLSASVFYKDFSKPVERFYSIGNATNGVEYKNLHGATARGFEIDIRKNFAFLNEGLPWLQNLYFTGNYTWLKGDISYAVTKSPYTNKDTSYIAESKRPIQGLSPYIINLGLQYQAKKWGINAVYNRIGRRIVNGGTTASIVQYENPRDVVDLQLNLKLYKEKMELRFNVADLLNQFHIVYSNNINQEYINGQPTGNYPGQGANNDPKGDAFNEQLDYINYRAKRGTNITIALAYKW